MSYLLKESFSGFKRARLASLTAVSSLAIAVLLLGLLLRTGFNAYNLAKSLRELVTVELFLKDSSETEIEKLKKELSGNPIIRKIEFISKKEAEKRFLEAFGSEGAALANLQFLPASYIIYFKHTASTAQIQSTIELYSSNKMVDEIRFDQKILQILESRIKTFALIGSGISFIIMFLALLLVYNTIRLTIFSKQTIIRAMKLVGATKGFIRRPFLIEGVIQGIVGSLVAFAGIYGLFDYLIPTYIAQIGVLAWPFGKWYFLAAIMTGFGSLLGLFGSLWATGKFIHAVRVSS
jgi:cell division transport system permease protein